jgi:bifunctional DNA-binding transcriptional regulator/antitoxin component of YhaV-PrlF toxin-antitoxin module
MDDFDYKKYSLQKLEDWVCDAISTAEATPQEVYDTIVSAITEYHDHHKKGFEHTIELLALLKGHRAQEWDAWEETYYPEEHKSSTEKGTFIGWNYTVKNDSMRSGLEESIENSSQYETKNGVNYNQYVKAKIEANSAWNDGWTREYYQNIVDKYEGKKDKVVKWILPVEETKIAETDETEYFLTFPDDLLEAADLKEGDTVEWVDQGNGSYLLKKVEKQMTHQEMLDAGYWMTDDGFWILKSDRC